MDKQFSMTFLIRGLDMPNQMPYIYGIMAIKLESKDCKDESFDKLVKRLDHLSDNKGHTDPPNLSGANNYYHGWFFDIKKAQPLIDEFISTDNVEVGNLRRFIDGQILPYA